MSRSIKSEIQQAHDALERVSNGLSDMETTFAAIRRGRDVLKRAGAEIERLRQQQTKN